MGASEKISSPLAASITFILTLIVYLLTLAPGLTLAHYGGDGGELITAAATLGVPHPQGYPTYVLLGKLFSWLPLGTVAYRFNLFSAVCMAAAAALLTLSSKVKRWEPTIAIGLTFAFSRLIWSQAIITEVYALNLLVLALLLLAIAQHRSPFWLGLLWGLSLTTHLTSLLMLPLVLRAVVMQPHQEEVFSIQYSVFRDRILNTVYRIPSFSGGILLGLLPFATIPLLARGDSWVVWSDPTTLAGWWWLVSGRIYRPNVFSHALLPRLAEQWFVVLRQFVFVGWVAIGYGVWKGRFRPKTILQFLTALAYGLYAFTYDTSDFAVFALPALLLLAPLLARGYQKVGTWSLMIPLVAILISFNAVNLHNDTTTQRDALALLSATPTDAILMTPGDESIFTLWYYQQVENVRLDVILVDENLFAFDWYRSRLAHLNPRLNALAVDDLTAFQQENGAVRPICTASIHLSTAPHCFGISE